MLLFKLKELWHNIIFIAFVIVKVKEMLTYLINKIKQVISINNTISIQYRYTTILVFDIFVLRVFGTILYFFK